MVSPTANPGVSVSTMNADRPSRPFERIGERIDDGDARLAAARDEPLVAVEDEVVAVGDGGRPNRARVGAGQRLGKRVASELFPLGEQRAGSVFFCACVAEPRNRIADERVVDGDDRAERRPRFRNLDEARHVGDEIVLAPEQADVGRAVDDRPAGCCPCDRASAATGATVDAANARARRWTSC